MQRYRRIIIFGGVIVIAIVATILTTGIFADFTDPQFQRSLLRLLALLGIAALLAMFGSLMARVETIDHLADHPAALPRKRK